MLLLSCLVVNLLLSAATVAILVKMFLDRPKQTATIVPRSSGSAVMAPRVIHMTDDRESDLAAKISGREE